MHLHRLARVLEDSDRMRLEAERVARSRGFTLAELMPGTRAYTFVAKKLVEVEVIYVRPPRAGARRVMLRRVDTKKILYQPRTVTALYRTPLALAESDASRPSVAKART